MNLIQFLNREAVRPIVVAIFFWLLGYVIHKTVGDKYRAPYWLVLISGVPNKDRQLSQGGTSFQFLGIAALFPRLIFGLDSSTTGNRLFVLAYLVISMIGVAIWSRRQRNL